jgi:hypothetical protein
MISLAILYLVSIFNLKWYLPIGCAVGVSGKILVADTDRDSCPEIFISDFQLADKINVCELHLPNIWEMDSFVNIPIERAWDIGDFDCDGLYDLLLFGTYGSPENIFFITESSDSFSYPMNEVWRDTVGPPAADIGDEVFDIDQDGYPELVKNLAVPYGSFGIYECIADNQYELIFTDTTSYGAPIATHAFGDFDQDGNNEVVFAGNRSLWIYESPVNNTYERVKFDTLPTPNIFDCFEVPDIDGDGKWEFVVKGFAVFGGIDAFIFEATDNNVYDTIKSFHVPGGDYYGGHSDAGDVDGDSMPEIVLEARQTVYIIKAAGNDSFYVWETLTGSVAGMNIKIFDLDNNGLNDIIMSGAQQTWIYEYELGVEEQAGAGLGKFALMVAPNPVADEFTLTYTLSHEAIVKMTIYDAAGRVVTVMDQGVQMPGTYHKSISRSDVSQGIYFIRLVADNAAVVEKVVFLK